MQPPSLLIDIDRLHFTRESSSRRITAIPHAHKRRIRTPGQ
jgi:hypothetical protein